MVVTPPAVRSGCPSCERVVWPRVSMFDSITAEGRECRQYGEYMYGGEES